MNYSIVFSFIFGGLLLLSIVRINNSVSEYAINSTMHNTVSIQLNDIRQFMMNDFQYFGFEMHADSASILSLENDKIEFSAWIDGGYRTISWEKTATLYPGSSNPDVVKLIRTGYLPGFPSGVETIFPVKHFYLQAYSDKEGTIVTVNPDNVLSISIELEVESTFATGSNGNGSPRYSNIGWSKHFINDFKSLKSLTINIL